MRSLGLLLVLLVALGPAAGCGGGGDDIAASTDAASSAPVATAPAPSSSGLTTEQLGAMLLTLEDMPTGWAKYDTEPAETPLCKYYGFRQQADDQVARNFSMSETGPVLVQTAFEFASPQEAQDVLNEFRARLQDCPPITDNEDGARVRTESTELSYPPLGDDSVAFRQTIRSSDGGVTVDAATNGVFVLLGPAVLGVGYAEYFSSSPDLDETDRFVRLAVERAKGVVGRTGA